MRYSYIRTPMNALLGYNQLMKKELTDPKLLHYQRAVEQSGNLLLVIINNVLDMARIESGRVELDESYARIDQTVDEIKSVFEPQADQKGLNLIFETQVEHQHVLCDITKTKQILVNLISNAVKYTPAGRIGMSKELRDISCLPVFRRCHLVIFFECLAKIIDILKTDIL